MEIIKWLVTSSADPSRYSATVKGALALGVAWMIQLTGLTCEFALFCIEPSVLSSIVETVGNIVYLGLSLVGALSFLFGLARKVWLNRVSAYPLPPTDLPR